MKEFDVDYKWECVMLTDAVEQDTVSANFHRQVDQTETHPGNKSLCL